MNRINFIDYMGLKAYHKRLMEYIDSLVINRAFEYSHCPNCGAIITGERSAFCPINRLYSWLAREKKEEKK